MNTLLIIVVVVALCYFGGAKCPKVLKDNKEMLLGVLVGLALCSFMGVRLEGFGSKEECLQACPQRAFACPSAFRHMSAPDCQVPLRYSDPERFLRGNPSLITPGLHEGRDPRTL